MRINPRHCLWLMPGILLFCFAFPVSQNAVGNGAEEKQKVVYLPGADKGIRNYIDGDDEVEDGKNAEKEAQLATHVPVFQGVQDVDKGGDFLVHEEEFAPMRIIPNGGKGKSAHRQ